MKKGKVVSRQFVPDASPEHLAQLKETIEKDGDASVYMIIDSGDQAYLQQSLPPVSAMSVGKMIKRRMDRDFRPDDIKGAIVLGRSTEKRKDWNFLMVSVDKSPQMTLWLDFVLGLENRFRGILLASVEAEIFVKNLEISMGIGKSGTGSEWKFLVSHNKVGGFRQVVLHKGRLIFTRMAQLVGEPLPEVIAGNIEQEILSTMEYIRRLSYTSQAGMDVHIIASEHVISKIDTRRFSVSNINLFTPFEAAELLGIEGASLPTDQFGDVVLASSIGASRKHILKLTTPQSRKYDNYQTVIYTQRLFATFTILGLLVTSTYFGLNALKLNSDIEDLEQKKRIQQSSLDQMKKQIADKKINVDAALDEIDLYQLIRSEVRSPMPFMLKLIDTIKPVTTDAEPLQIAVLAVDWSIANSKDVPAQPTPAVPSPAASPVSGNPTANTPAVLTEPIIVKLKLLFPAGLRNADMYKRFSQRVVDRFKANFKGYEITLGDAPAEYRETENFTLKFEKDSKQKILGDKPVEVNMQMLGNMIMDGEAKKP